MMETPSALTRALDLIELGFPVFPLIPGTKRAAVKWKAYQDRLPSREELETWFARARADAPIAMITGTISGIVVVDADSLEADAWAATNLPPTPLQVLTHRGRHLYYRHPGGRVANRVRIGELDLDLRGDGGYTVAPGSRHPRGGYYRAQGPWSSEGFRDLPALSLGSLPAGFSDPAEFQPPWPTFRDDDRERAFYRARKYAQKVDPAISGSGGHAVTFRLACYLVRRFGLLDAEALAILAEWNRTCSPPWSERDLRHKIAQARTRGRDRIGSLLEQPARARGAHA